MENVKLVMRWGAIALAVVALVFAYVSPHHGDAADPASDSPPPAMPAPTTSQASAAAAQFAVSPTPSSAAVYVVGAVNRAGVYHVAPDARIVDALHQAGGMTKDADPEAINLAAQVADGMKVDVPRKGASPTSYADDGIDTATAKGASGTRFDLRSASPGSSHSSRHRSAGRAGSHKLQPGQTLDVNTATEGELTQLPGVGPSLARRIVEYREANGPFATPDDLQNVSGIGPSKFAKMADYVKI